MGFKPMLSEIPVQLSHQLSYEATTGRVQIFFIGSINASDS